MQTPRDPDAIWQQMRAAILRRMDDPSPENYADVRRLSDELVRAQGEDPEQTNVVPLRRRAA